MTHYFAIDIGGTFVKYSIISDQGTIEGASKIATPKTLDELIGFISDFCASQQQRDLAGIAISSPGGVSESGIIYGSSAVHYLHGPNIKELIEASTGLPVHIENDANCAGYAEVWQGAAQGKKDVLVMVIGTSIGGAIIKDGKIHKGAHLHGGEFGYMLLTSNPTSEDDIWSRQASTRALVRKVAARKQQELTGEEIFTLADNGDPICQQAVDEFYHILAVGIYNLQYIYDPEIIVIGGGISARADLIDRIREKLDQLLATIPLAKITPAIAACTHQQNANMLGAVYAGTRGQAPRSSLGLDK